MKPLATLRILLILTALLLAALIAVFTLRPQQGTNAFGTLGGDFTLQSAQGPVALEDFRGKVVAMYIGYASCPDVCPTALAVMTQAFRNLPANQLDNVAGLFVSVDPERDTPEKLAAYAKFFHPNITGVTGNKSEIDQVTRQYGAFYRKVEMADSALGYAVDHSSRIYLIDPDGNLHQTLLHNSTPSELTEAITTLLTR